MVSVVMPFLNAAPFIVEAIESVVQQTYDRWELLLIDDGSTDNSVEIVRSFQQRYPSRIKLLETPGQTPRGASAARNRGLGAATGELIGFLDADDVWLPRKLEEQIALLDEHPDVGMLYGRTIYWHSWAQEPAAVADYIPALGFPAGTVVSPPALLAAALRGDAELPCTCSLIVRRSVIDQVGGFEEGFRRVYTDQAFYTKLFVSASVLVADGCWDRYRQHPHSSCNTAERTGDLKIEHLRYLDWAGEYLVRRKMRGTESWWLIQEERLRLRHPTAYRFARALWRGRKRPIQAVRRVLYQLTPAPVRRRLDMQPPEPARIPPGRIRFGSLRRTAPVSRQWGWDRGLPIDRYYIVEFLQRYAGDVRGRVLEIGDASYTRRFGGARVAKIDVLHVDAGNPLATIVGNLAEADHIPSNSFDCIILTQTLHLVYDFRAAMGTLYRILAPEGVLLLTVPGISQTTDESWRSSWYWSFTQVSMEKLAGEQFPAEAVQVEVYGNVLSATAFLHGLAAQELSEEELQVRDRDFPVTVALRAIKFRRPPPVQQ